MVHRHLHPHPEEDDHAHSHAVRSPATAFGIGLVHGVGGSAGIALLLLAGIGDRLVATGALLVFAVATALSMAVVSAGLGLALGLPRVERGLGRALPAFAVLAFAFGAAYAAAAV